MKCTSLALLALATAPGLADVDMPASAPDFEAQVLPLLESRCFECHSAARAKPKGKLRLDGVDWILAGGRGGAVLTPGAPDESPMFRRVSLPPDDLDVMPPEGAPLDAEKRALLRDWIAAGADFGGWKGAPRAAGAPAPRADVPEPERIRVWRALGEGLAPFDVSKLDEELRAVARIEPLFEESPLLRVSFHSREEQVTDALLAKLAPALAHVAHLDLARTPVTDAGLAHLVRAPRLTHLSLKDTEVGDAGIERLAELPELRVLNLYGTRVTDSVTAALVKPPRLSTVHLSRSGVTESGVEALREARPGLEIRWSAALRD